MSSTTERITQALHAVLRLGFPAGVTVQRNAPLPEAIPGAGLVILRDGDPGEPVETRLSPRVDSFEHEFPVELFAQGAEPDVSFDALRVRLGQLIEANRTLGGQVDWIEVRQIEAEVDPFDGAPSVKYGTVILTVHYDSSNPLT